MTKVLFVSSEAHPLVKTGGLGDVSGSLPATLKSLGQDVRLLLPAYRQVLAKGEGWAPVASVDLPGTPGTVRILRGRMPDSQVEVWLVDHPDHFDRDGGPYLGPDGHDWPDNAQRFTLFCRAAVELAMDRAGLGWRPEVVHCNDWQSGLAPALLAREAARPATVFTIHNLAYQGLFPRDTFISLGLPHDLWSMHAMEFHGHFSFIKGGLVFADWVTTVSPTYAREIRTPDYGYGLDGLLTHRSDRLTGILNGVDYSVWDPAHDPLIPTHYTARTLPRKQDDKRALQERLGLPEAPSVPLVGMVGRMVDQKGGDLALGIIPHLLARPVQFAIVGTGDRHIEHAFQTLAAAHPDRMGIHIGYSEELAHLVEAGADMFLMPSRFEPCGLNQIYSLRYGTVPIVRRTGGLADTVADATPKALKDGTATGFVFEDPTTEALLAAMERALDLYPRTPQWRRLARTGMAKDYSWEVSARHYLEVYSMARETART